VNILMRRHSGRNLLAAGSIDIRDTGELDPLRLLKRWQVAEFRYPAATHESYPDGIMMKYFRLFTRLHVCDIDLRQACYSET
jgi:hypothetical protein